ncbi:MAG: RNA polymerase factor sigma-54 [Sphingopyxis sp.]|nr:RNA polymerase factor sigma-54 [Sphingopyxis sp.]
MALGPRLDLRQSQSLVMTPQLQQAIKLLALSNLELEAYLAEALEGNPLLDTASADSDGSAGDPDGAPGGDAPVAEAASLDADQALAADGGSANDLDVDLAADSFHHDSASDNVGLTGSGEDIDFDSFADLREQMVMERFVMVGERFSGIEAIVAGQLVALIDETGYLRADLTELAAQLGVPLALLEEVLAGIQCFDPSGVGGRDLAECIAIQAREADRYDPAMATMIAHLDLVAKGAFPQLKRICGVDDEDLADMIRELRSYDPKPGLKFGGDGAPAVVPDLFIRQTAKGWAVEINSGTLPRLLVNRRYYTELAQGAAAKSKAWLSEQLAGANWLVRALDQRQRTIVKVASAIVKQQEGFFLHGVAHMRPLTLRQVAEEIGMHESTVSRVTSNKYLSCARGLFELKYFFSSGISATEGEGAVSSESIKSRIKAMIEAEDGKAILSDETIAQKLSAEGHDIARRTVVKYREAMGYGSSVQRRRQKALAG